MEELNELQRLVKQTEENNRRIAEELEKLKRKYSDKVENFSKVFGMEIDEDKLQEFFREFYYIYSTKSGEWMIAVPKWIPFSVGWLDHETNSYYVYRVNNYTQWLGDMPDFLKKELGMKTEKDVLVDDGNLVFPKERKDEMKKKYGDLLQDVGDGIGHVKLGKEFDIIARIVRNGGLPFVPTPVDKSFLREPTVGFKLEGKYEFQKDAYDKFMKYGAVGIFWQMGSGKSFVTMYILDSIKGKKVLFVPTNTLKEQWRNDYFAKYAPRLLDEVEIYHYSMWDKVKDKEYSVAVFDECDYLSAPTYSKLSTIKARWRIGLSGSPYRESKDEYLIFALTGYPIGLAWKHLMKILGKEYHQVNVHVVANQSDKMVWLDKLFDREKKTFISVFKLDEGEEIAKKYKIPFVSGGTEKRMDVFKDNKAVVMSKVGTYGISIKDLQHIIEFGFHFGSRADEIQLTGRLLHGANKGAVHDILMTKHEYLSYGKRLNSLVDKGWFPRIIAHTDLYSAEEFRKPIATEKKKKLRVKKSW